MTTDNETSSGDWRDNVAALLAAMPHGTWTATTDLGQALGRRASDILTFFAAAHPDGHDRVLSDTGRLRRGAAFKGANRNERASALAEVGIVFDEEGCADPAMRLDVGDLWALAADPDNGVGPGRARRTWLDAPGFNDTLADRHRITAMVDQCTWNGAAESFASLPNRHVVDLVPHLPRSWWRPPGSPSRCDPRPPPWRAPSSNLSRGRSPSRRSRVCWQCGRSNRAASSRPIC
jgi:hypothetical protein